MSITQEMGGLRKWGARETKGVVGDGGMRKGEDVQDSSFDLLLSVASNVMHSQRLHSFTIIHMPEHNSREESLHQNQV